MMKRLALITYSSSYANSLCNNLQKLFDDIIEVNTYSYDFYTISQTIYADLFNNGALVIKLGK